MNRKAIWIGVVFLIIVLSSSCILLTTGDRKETVNDCKEEWSYNLLGDRDCSDAEDVTDCKDKRIYYDLMVLYQLEIGCESDVSHAPGPLRYFE